MLLHYSRGRKTMVHQLKLVGPRNENQTYEYFSPPSNYFFSFFLVFFFLLTVDLLARFKGWLEMAPRLPALTAVLEQ